MYINEMSLRGWNEKQIHFLKIRKMFIKLELLHKSIESLREVDGLYGSETVEISLTQKKLKQSIVEEMELYLK